MIEVYTSPEQVIRIFVYIIIGIGALGICTVLYVLSAGSGGDGMISFIIGLVLGTWFGFVMAAVLVASRRD